MFSAMKTNTPGRPTILVLVGTYLPGYKAGGQLRTVSNIVNALGDEFDFRIVTTDRDSGDATPYPGIMTDCWLKVGRARVRYLSPRQRGLWSLARLIDTTPHEVLYLNSFFSPVYTILPLIATRSGLARRTPTIIAPRGELSAGAIGLKTEKKLAYLAFYNAFLSASPVLFHASSALERGEIDFRIHRPHETFVAPDIASFPASVPQFQADEGPLRMCFLSRISPKKNLSFALEALRMVSEPVALDIYGPTEDGAYWEKCQAIMRELPPNVQARYCGQVAHDDVMTVFSRYELFLFPTLGENFGHVIVESLLAGTPVLLADTTPWMDLNQSGAGRVLPLGNPSPWARAIDEFASADPPAKAAARKAARQRAEAFCHDASVVSANRELFLHATRM